MRPMMTFTCPRCFGVGHFERWKHIADGRCFRCGGAGVVEMPREELFHEDDNEHEQEDGQ